MADKVIRVPVVAEFQTDLRSLQDIEKALSGAFEKAGTGTAIAKGLKDSLAKIRPLLKEYEQLQIQPTIDQAGVRRMNTIFDSIIREYSKRASQIEFADPEAMLPEEVLTRIRAMRTEVASLKKEMETIQRHGASGKSDDYFQRREATAAQQDLHRRAKEALPSKYSGDATLQQNASVVEKEATAAAQRAAALAEQGRKLAEALKQAEAGIEEAQTALWQATGELQTATAREGKAQKAANASKFYTALGGLTVSKTKEHAIVGGAGLRQSAFVDQSGKLQTEFQTLLRSVLQETGIEIDASRLIAESNASEIPGKIRQAIVDVLGDSEEAITQVLEEFKARAQQRLTRVDTEGFANADQFLKSAREQRRTAQTTYDRAQQKAKEAPEKAFAIGYQIEENDDAQREAQETAAALQTLSAALKEVAAVAKEAAVAAKKSKAEDKEREVRETTEKERNKIAQPLESTNKNLGPARDNHQEGNRKQSGAFSQESNAQREAESFQQSMKNAVKQWLSIQQIINIVKQGIRQAYQDIQGLDKAMTNIAVVTDMSVSNLWGKINEYMSIAQQYGVTTQGVYEVSQLYYQQGLGTSEVMAATTETLKLARVAGMGYAEAADAMTVAIRSFKMEMSDAAVVTDVYSKVAAVTASSQEELAIAMSKTASSAESVGSSFENTTAMLAVMIETTRESAQNLGSALKSIISRYGEMKVGLTVDSEGEDIDYNKVDTALKSIGISIKDAQGQFRDFDEVIFELSEKWDSLDKNTQRYVATIMAGNRQQSRFIALVDNWERLDEVATAAQDSEDAGLLQYAKTLDSLETKLNNIKTSFQQFYMAIFNGPVIGAILEFINNLIQGLNQLGSLQGVLNLASLITGLRSGLSLIGNLFANTFGGIITNWRNAQEKMVKEAFTYGQKEARAKRAGIKTVEEGTDLEDIIDDTPGEGEKTRWGKNQSYSFGVRSKDSGRWGKHFQYKTEGKATAGKITGVVASFGGTALTSAATAAAANNPQKGALMSVGGNALQGLSMGAAFGPWGMGIGAVLGALSGLPGVIKAFDENNQRQFEYEQAKKAAEEQAIVKAETKNEYTSFKEILEKYDTLKDTRFDSDENYQAWIDANKQLAEAYPELISYIDAEGNAIVDVTNASQILESAMQKAAQASEEYYRLKRLEYDAQISANKDYQYTDTAYDLEATSKTYKKLGLIDQDAQYYYSSKYDDSMVVDFNEIGKMATIKRNVLRTGAPYPNTFTAEGLAKAWEALGLDPDMLLLAAKGGKDSAVYNELTSQGQAWVDFLKSEHGLQEKDMFRRDSNDNILGWETHLEKVLAGRIGLQELAINDQLAFQDAVYWKTEASNTDNALEELSGTTAIIGKFLQSKGYTESTQIDSGVDGMTVEEYDTEIAELIAALNNIAPIYQEDLANLYDQLDNYSHGQLEQAFANFGGANSSNPLWNVYESLWTDQNYRTAYRYGTALQEGYNIGSYEEWLENQTDKNDTSANRAKYYKDTLKELDSALETFIKNHTSNTVENYISLLKNAENMSDKGIAGTIAQDRANFVKEVITGLDADGTYGDLSLADTDSFLNLLTAENAGTQEWADSLIEFAKEHNITLTNLEDYVFENFNTQLQAIFGSSEDVVKTYKDYASKQQSGFAAAEAEKIAKELGGEDALVSDYFTVTKDGLLVMSDFETALNKFWIKRFNDMNAFSQKIIDAETILKEQFELYGTLDPLFAYTDTNTIETILSNGLSIDKELAATLAPLIAKKEIDTEEKLWAWLEAYKKDLQIVIDSESNTLESFFKADKKRQKVIDLQKSAKDAGVNTDKIAAYDSILSKGLTGYTAEEMASIALAFGWKEEEHFILDTATGTYDIKSDILSNIEFMNSVPMEYRNQLLSLLDQETTSALDAIKQLGASVAAGDKGVYGKTFDKTLGYKAAETLIPQWVKAAYEGRTIGSANAPQDPAQLLKEQIAAELSAETGITIQATDPRVIQKYNELMDSYADSLDDNLVKFLELKEKELFGTISETERATLDNLNLDGTLKSELTNILSKAGSTTIDKYVAMMRAALASGANWEEIEQYVSDGYKAKFASLFGGFEAADLDTYKVLDTIEGAEGVYTEDILSSFATQFAAEAKANKAAGKSDADFEKEVNEAMTLFENAFDYDITTGQATLKAGTDWNTIFANFMGADGKLPSWLLQFTESFNTGEAAKATNDLVKKTDLPDKLTKTASQMFSGYADLTLESFISFYEEIFGEDSFDGLDEATKTSYISAIQAAQKGNLESLNTVISGIITKASTDKGISLDSAAITDTYNDTIDAINAQFIEYQLKALQGNITNTEQGWLDNFTLIDNTWQKELATTLSTEGNTIVTQYGAIIQAAIKSGLPWEQISGTVSDAYNQQLIFLANEVTGTTIKQADTYSAIQGIEEAEGYYSQEALASLFTQMGAEGIDIDTAKVKDYFTWDKAAQAWVLKQGQSIDAALTALFGDSTVPTEVKTAFTTSQEQKEAGDKVRADTLAKNTTSTISAMMGNLANVSLAEIEELYESVKNTEIDKSTLATYEAAIEQAKQGNYDSLITLLTGLATEANADIQAINAAKLDGLKNINTKYLALQKKVLDGTVTETEKNELTGLKEQVNTDWSNTLESILGDESKDAAEKYAAIVAAAAKAGIPWEVIEGYAAEAFSSTLNEALYGYTAKSEKTYKAVQDLKDAEGLFSGDVVNSWLTQMQAEANANGITDTAFTDYLATLFTADEQGNLIWSGNEITTDIRTILKSYFSEGDPAWLWLEPFIASLEAANKVKATNDLIDADSLQNEVNTTISSLFTNAADSTLADIQTLYDSVKGEGKFKALAAEEQQKWQTALNEAAKGNLSFLNTLINELIANDPNIDSSEITNIYKDANDEISSKFLELSLKKITGTLTAQESSWLSSFALDDTEGWQKTLTDALSVQGADITNQYAALIIAATSSKLPWEKIQSYVTDAYKYQLSGMSEGFNVKDLGTYDAIENIEKAAGHYGEDVLSSLFAQITHETGKPVDLTTFSQYFSFDEATQSWMLQTGRSVSDFYQTATGEVIPEYLSKAFSASEAQRAVDNALDKASKGDSISNTISGLIKDASDVTLDTLVSLYEDIHGEGTFKDSGLLTDYQKAINDVQSGSVDALRKQLLVLVDAAKAKDYDIDTSALNAAYEDAIHSLIEGLTSAIKKGIEGTLSASEYNSLIQQYGLSGKATKTTNGLQLNAADQRRLIAEMYKQASANGSTQGLGKEVWNSFGGDPEKLLGTYESVTNEIAYITRQIEEFGDDPSMAKQRKEAEAYLAVLKQIEETAYLDPNNPLFNFMDQKATDGFTDNFDSYVESIEKVKTAFASLQKKGEYITYNDFYNMMDFLNTSGQWESFAQQVNLAGRSYEDFVNSVVANTDKWGHVNIEGIAAEMGISVDAAMEVMSDSMTEGLKAVARQQIKYLSGLETMLKAMIALEELGNLNLEMNIELSDGTVITKLSEVADNWERLNNTDKTTVLTATVDLITQMGNTEAGKSFMSSLGLDGVSILDAFFGGEITEDNIHLADAFGTMIEQLPNLTQGQVESLAIQMRSVLADSLIFDENNNFVGLASGWETALAGFFTGLDYTAIPEIINSEVTAAMANAQVTTFEVNGCKVTLGENGLIFEGTGEQFEANKEALIQQMEEKLGIDIGDLTLGSNGAISVIPPEVTTEAQSLTSDFESIEDAAEGVITAMNTLQEILEAFQVSEQFREFVRLVSSMYGNPEATDGSTDMDMQIAVDTSDALNAVTSFQTSFEAMKAAIENNPIIIRAQGNLSTVVTRTGTMNDISGQALADGSIGRMYSGAELAQKTLVGELGPELAVYDGEYHMLGAHGAEFVDLPSDAIVFNHLQTAGIMKGQMNVRGTAMADGNVHGPALAGGASAALASVQRAKAVWQGILGMTAQDLVNAGGGGGGGNSLKAVTAELQEWYNLTRQIENLEQEINNLIAERENIAKDNGEKYLKNLRETQKLLGQQKLTQQILLDYQEKQLERQRDHINNHSIWSKFITIDENGLLQYIKGNETNGGKGTLDVLKYLNSKSAEEQVKFVTDLGYSYTDVEGKKYKDSELVGKFFEELQDQIDQYHELYDTVNGTKETVEGLITSIEDINEEIVENQKELEKEIYDILVEAWEKEITALEEQTELIQEANSAYVEGIREALDAEKSLYEDNKSIEERESLQRQLSLLRRSGGSASEIADLEEQLNDTLKDEYFKNQERMIKNIEDANEEQVKKLEEQITLQKEALEYQKENGVLWTEVYNILAGTKEEILKFMQGKHTKFFSQSVLKQEEMLTDWAHKIGIYTEDRQYENHIKAATSIWDSNDLWNGETLKGLKETYEGLSSEQQAGLKNVFSTTYADSLLSGTNDAEAKLKAEKTVGDYLGRVYNEDGSYEDTGEIKDIPTSSGEKIFYGGYDKDLNFHSGEAYGEDNLAYLTKQKGIITDKGKDWYRTSKEKKITGWRWQFFGNGRWRKGYLTKEEAQKAIQNMEIHSAIPVADRQKIIAEANRTLKQYSTGGLVDYTGLAMVHGSKSRPESFLNASQTAQIKEALEATNGKENLLSGLQSTIGQLRSLIHNILAIDNSTNSNITIAPGAVVINVDQLADSYDVEALSADIMNRMVSIASKATNRGVNRR